MNILFINLASSSPSIACCNEQEVLAIEKKNERISDAALLPLIEHVLKATGWSYKDLTHIANVTGPGGFTSLRVAAACANTLSYALQIPSAGIHLSTLSEAMLATDYLLPTTCWLHSTKRNLLFIKKGDSDDIETIAPEELPVRLSEDEARRHMQWHGELLPEHRAILDDLGMKEIDLQTIEDALPRLLAEQSYTMDLLEPWYGREG